MALSIVTIPGDGVTDTFTVNFALGFIDRANITAWVTGEVDGLGAKIYRTITFLTDTMLKISGPPAGAGINVVFTRTVSESALVVNYEDGDIMNEENLNTAQKQALMLVHQVLDGRFSAFIQDVSSGGFRITDLGTPINPNDAATKGYADSLIATGAANAAAAAASAAAALASQNVASAQAGTATAQAGTATAQAGIATTQAANALASANAADVSEANADASEAMAQEWAEKAEDSPITGNPGKFSALHWAAKAASYVAGNLGLAIASFADKPVPVGADQTVIADSANSNNGKRLSLTNLRNWILNQTTIISKPGDANDEGILRLTKPDFTAAQRFVSMTMGRTFAVGESVQYGYMHSANAADRGAYIVNYGESQVTNSIFLRAGGFVGIGTNVPTGKLHVVTGLAGPTNPTLVLESTDAGALQSPVVELWRNSPSPALNDILTQIRFMGQTSTGVTVAYGSMYAQIADPLNATASARLYFATTFSGIASDRMNLGLGLAMTGATDPGAGKINAVEVQQLGVPIRPLTLATPVLASGTAVDFTGIPSWARRVTITFASISTIGTSRIALKLGTSGGIAVSGYSGGGGEITGTSAGTITYSTSFSLITTASTQAYSGKMILNLQDIATNSWVLNGNISAVAAGAHAYTGGQISLAGVLDRVRITTDGGTQTFDAGTLNISWE